VNYCRGRDDHRGFPPAQIRTSASTHTALTKDGWRRSVHRDRVQNAGWRNPSVQDWGKAFPTHLCALTAADQNALPWPAHAEFEDAQLSRVPGNSVVLVITQYNLPEPPVIR
jgi:hypothetical protein